MKKLLTHLPKALLLLFVMLAFVQANGQARYAPLAPTGISDFQLTIDNDIPTSTSVMQFDLWLKDMDAAQPFELQNLQAGILFRKNICTGTPTVIAVPGSSQLVAGCQFSQITVADAGDGTNYVIKCAANPQFPGCGAGSVINPNGNGTRVVTIRITCASGTFTTNSQPYLTFNFTDSPYPTKVFQRVNCTGTQLACSASNCKAGTYYANCVLNPSTAYPAMFNVGGGGCVATGATASITLSGSASTATYQLFMNGTLVTGSQKTGTGSLLTWATQPGSAAGNYYEVKATTTSSGNTRWMNGYKMITYNPAAIVFNALPDICEGTPPVALSATPNYPAGVFSGTGVILGGGGYQFSSAVGAGTWPVTYNYTNFGGCSSTAVTQNQNVNAKPVTAIDPFTTDVCVGTTYTLTANPPGGTFSGPGVVGDQFTPTSTTTVTIIYNYFDPITLCVATPTTLDVTPIICAPATPTWTGAVSTEWNLAGNWWGGFQPTPSTDAIIPATWGSGNTVVTNFPNILPTETFTVANITISGSGAKSALTGGMSISGELDITGNMTITPTGSVDVTADGALTISGNLTINGALLVENQGSLITNTIADGSIATIQRYIAKDQAWHLLSSPVSQESICNNIFAPLTTAFPIPAGAPWDFYKWYANCALNHWQNLRAADGTLNTTDFGMNPGFTPTRGYLVAYAAASTLPATKNFIGKPNTGDLYSDLSEIYTNCTWSLLGNPFPSALYWNDVTGKANLVADYYYVWNQAKGGGAGGYEFSNGTFNSSAVIDGYIPSMQGFFVKVKWPTGSDNRLYYPNTARRHHNSTDMWLKNTSNNLLTVTLSNGTYFDDAFIMFSQDATVGQDRQDAEKLFTMSKNAPELYTIVNNDLKAALNAMPYVNNGTTIPVGIVAPADGDYSITVKGIETFSSLAGLTLEDLKLNYTQNLLTNPVYNFTATGNEDAGRFLLHFAGAIGIGEKNNSTINIYSNEKTVFVTCAAGFHNAQVTISNLLGQDIVTQKLTDQTINQVKVNALKGYYIVKVQNESSVKTAKVYIN